MKTYLLLFVFIAALFPLHVFSQSEMEDVIYLKNGTIYRGTITEQVPGVSYRIRVARHIILAVQASEIEKVAKEPKVYTLNEWGQRIPLYRFNGPFYYQDKGYFFLANVNAGSELGFNIINGYKFGQFGFLGIGAGIDWVYAPIGAKALNNVSGNYSPSFASVFLYYGGDIWRKKITPFYNIYAGYGVAMTQPNTDFDFSPSGLGAASAVQGGPMGGAGFGVRFYALRNRFNFSIAVNVTVQSAIYWNDSWGSVYTYGQYSGTSYSYSSGAVLMTIPTFSFGFGF